MRKSLSLILSFIFALTVVISAAEPAMATTTSLRDVHIKSFKADKYSIIRGENNSVTFTAQIDTKTNIRKTDVSIYDDTGTFIAHMNDNGTDGDVVKNDGIYSDKTTLYDENIGLVKYHVEVYNEKSDTFQIKTREIITDKDFAESDRIWDNIKKYESILVMRGLSKQQIAKEMYDFLLRTEKENIATINFESDKSFGFIFKSGIENYYEYLEKDEMMSSDEDFEAMAETVRELAYIDSSSIGVWSPYYGAQSDFTYNYRERAYIMQKTAGYETVDTYYGREAGVESFKNFDKYGIIMIDSHGSDYNGGGYICINWPGTYDQQDIAEGHLVNYGGTVCMRGTYMEKYCNMLPNTILYVGICYGMAANNLSAPLLRHGAQFICAYSNSVSFKFDGIMMNDFCQLLAETNPATNSQYTAGEAFRTAISHNGDTDPYSSSRARFVCQGNNDAVASAKRIPVESVVIEPCELTLYTNNSYQLNMIINPSDANRYDYVWSSDNPDAVSVDQDGTVHAGVAGEAVITVTVTDKATAEFKTLTATAKITNAGDMHVNGIEILQSAITLYSHTEMSQQIKAQVLPVNATNQNLLYESEDASIATVDDKGIVRPENEGLTRIIVKTEEGGYTGYVVVSVESGDINEALNAQGGMLEFINDSKYPAEVVAIDGRFAVQTTNKNSNSTSTITLEAGYLKAGSKISFSWKVGSEVDYDQFKFSCNGNTLASISGFRSWSDVTYEIQTDGEYTFKWFYSKDYSTNAYSDCGFLDDVDLFRKDQMYTVTFMDMDGETVIDTQNVMHGESAKAPEAPTHPGYEFIAWDKDYMTIRSDMVITALYNKLPESLAKVTFIGYDGVVLDEQTVTIGQGATAPENTDVEGMVFLGWDADFSCVDADMEVHAIYGIRGDANNDGVFNTGDATMILRSCSQLVTLDEVQTLLADANNDNVINTGDASYVLKIVAAE